MMEEIISKITIASLTALKEKKISTIQAVKNQIEKKKAASERFKTNQWFDLNEGSFYKHLTNTVKVKVLGRGNTATTTKDELQEFGSPIWENASEKKKTGGLDTKRRDSFAATYRAAQSR